MNDKHLEKPILEKPDFDTLELHFNSEGKIIPDENARKCYEWMMYLYHYREDYMHWLFQEELLDRFPQMQRGNVYPIFMQLDGMFNGEAGK